MKTSLESLTSRITDTEDRISDIEAELHNTSIHQKRQQKVLKERKQMAMEF